MLAEHAPAGKVSERQLSQIRDQLKECAAGLGGEVSVRQRRPAGRNLSEPRR